MVHCYHIIKTIVLVFHVFFVFFLVIFIAKVMGNTCSYLFDSKLLSYYEDCFFGLACLFRLLLVIFITRVMGTQVAISLMVHCYHIKTMFLLVLHVFFIFY